MIKMTMFLLFGIGATMYFADDLAKPTTDAEPELVAVVEPADAVEIDVQPKPETVLEGLSFASIQTTEPVAEPLLIPEPAKAEIVTLVPFMEPTLVNRDGTVTIAPEPIEIAATEPEEQIIEAIQEPIANVWFVTARAVNVRAGPSTSNGVLGRVVYAEAVELLSDPTDEWVHIRIEGDGVEGFMASRFLQKEDPQG